MNLDIQPMLGMFGLGGGEMILLLMGLAVLLIPSIAVVAIVYIVLNRPKKQDMFSSVFEGPLGKPIVGGPAKQGQPPQASQPAPAAGAGSAAPLAQNPAVATKTEVMARKCPQCGAALPADAPEGLCPACLLQRGFATEGAGGAGGQSNFVPPSAEELARLFPQLEIIGCLGRGGMGAVYKARQPRLDRFVALKILAPEKQNDPQFAERFEREARVLARLSHPNIVSVYDFGEVQGHYYLLMEYVDGLTLRQVMQAEKISAEQALELVPKICEALQYAHGQGIVHRDIKPENILLDKQGRLKIADFGIAKIAGVEGKGMSLTGARDIMGTPVYMAPEQVEKPQTVDHRADIYSLGVVFYEMLTGELPLGKFSPPSKKVQVDVRLDEVVLHALEKEPARRYQQASQVKTAVETIAGSPPPIGAVTNSAAAAAVAMDGSVSDKIILPAFLLAFFFGPFGAHRFYVGKYGTAVLQLFTCGGLGIWATIDWILLACGVFTDADGRRMKNWVHPGPSLPKTPKPAPANFPQGGAAAATAPRRSSFGVWFAVAAVCVVLTVAVAAIGLGAMIFIGKARAYGDTPGPVKILTPEELKAAGIRQENGEYWKNSTQSFPMDADGRFSIDNVTGRIQVEGWSSNLVVLDATIHGKTGECVDYVKINIDSDPHHATVHTEQPSNLTGFPWSWEGWKNDRRNNAIVDYVVHVPAHGRNVDVSTVNGTVSVAGTAGDIEVSTVNGDTDIKNAVQNLKISTVNGTATAKMVKLGAGQLVSFSAVNGEFDLTLPEDAAGDFTVTTINGNITSDFPSLKSKRELVGNNLKGTLGNGGAKVKANAVNGTVKFLKAPAPLEAVTNAAVPISY